MAGELVVIGEVLEAMLELLAAGDETQHAEQALRAAGGAGLHGTPLMHPGETALAEADACLLYTSRCV